MDDNSHNLGDANIGRRTLLHAGAAAGLTVTAGCLGDDDSEGVEDHTGVAAGARVPEVHFEYETGFGDSTALYERIGPIITDNIEEHLGMSVDFYPKEGTTHQQEMYADARNTNIQFDGEIHLPYWFLELDGLIYHLNVQDAGEGISAHTGNYVNCEYSELVYEQRRTTDQEERNALIREAMGVLSEDAVFIGLVPRVYYGAYRSDMVELDPGESGIIRTNTAMIRDAEPVDDAPIGINTPAHAMVGVNHLYSTDDAYALLLNNLVYSTLLSFNRQNELTGNLAQDWELGDDLLEAEFTLREDAVFHDGEPVTADDVVFSFELYQENSEEIPAVGSYPYESIEATDDHTVVFNFSDAVPSWEVMAPPLVAIFPEHIWSEADDALEFEPDPAIGSGPAEVVTFRDEELMQLDPFEDHWDPVNGPVEFRAYGDAQGEVTALQDGEISILSDIPTNIAYDVLEGEDNITLEPFVSPVHNWIHLEHHFGPMMFRELRLAISYVLDRAEIAEAAYRGDADPDFYSSIIPESHPMREEWDDDEVLTRIADSEEPDPDRAREILEEAGWTWDDDDRLVYPDDLSEEDEEPLFPQGDKPTDYPDQFPCVEDYDWY